MVAVTPPTTHINYQHISGSDSPVVTVWQSYSQPSPQHNITLELVCTVTAFPAAKVDWSREGGTEVVVEKYRVEYHEDQENQDTVKHLLLIDNPSQEVIKSGL